MGQTATPASFSTTSWTGTAASLAAASDATYVQAPSSPTSAQTFLCTLAAITDPGFDTSHTITVRAMVDTAGADLDLTLVLENSDDSSEVASWTLYSVGESFSDTTLSLTEAEAATIHSYSGLQIRGYAFTPTYTTYAFVWSETVGATGYVLQVRPVDVESYIHDANVGNVLTHEVSLAVGTYYARVIPYIGSVPQTASAEVTVTVT